MDEAYVISQTSTTGYRTVSVRITYASGKPRNLANDLKYSKLNMFMLVPCKKPGLDVSFTYVA